jgi:thiol-disulfide isomerase/thioredoxin
VITHKSTGKLTRKQRRNRDPHALLASSAQFEQDGLALLPPEPGLRRTEAMTKFGKHLAIALVLAGAPAAPLGCADGLAQRTPAPRPSAGPVVSKLALDSQDAAPRAPRSLLDVPLTTLAGGSVKLADLGGHVTVIGVWATWCKPCLLELPFLDAVKRRYAHDPKVHVVAVSIDDVGSVEEFGRVKATVNRLGIKLPVYFDQTGRLARQLMGPVQSVPLLAILDRDLRMLRERGFDISTKESSYVAAKSALIELARKGELPASDPSSPEDRESGAILAALREDLKRAYPELSEERIDELLQDLEERMHSQKRRPQRGSP